ncbi:Gfo/Idh/MocA family protein [Paenibacillus cymbidii]|uniref:Gfo/Idh/MocA family protein n=1 Tax=Paenibacillus cymbidii TaxID=1639034 RepID=UPI0010819C81|nr:Gfo/Idh/MocA family oxidoreductase [Paenibacillus cymbidii]
MAGSIKAVLIGMGRIVQTMHYPALASLPDVEIAGICDPDCHAPHNRAAAFGASVPRYADYRQMIDELAPDIVYAIGQPHQMYDIWRWCLEQGITLFVEKPLGFTPHQARTLAYLADRHRCVTQVGFQRRTHPMVAMLRDECLKRGPIHAATCRFYKHGLAPHLKLIDQMMVNCTHTIDTVRWMCGGEVIAVESLTRRIGVPDINYVSATLHFDNGSAGYVHNYWASGRRIFAVEMHGNDICAEAEHEGKGYLYAGGDANGHVFDARHICGGDEPYVYCGFRHMHRQFVDCVKTGKPPASPFADALKTMEIAEKIIAQSVLAGR